MAGARTPLSQTFPVRTDRLRLRLFEPRDLDALHSVQSDPDVVRYVPYRPRTKDQVRAALQERLDPPAMQAAGDVLRLVAERLDDGTFVGELTLFLLDVEHEQGEIGFMVHPSQQRQGFAAEAAVAVLELGFRWLGLHRLIGQCDARNHGSAAVMRRAGMRQEAHLVHPDRFKGEWADLLVFAMLADEWSGAATTREA